MAIKNDIEICSTHNKGKSKRFQNIKDFDPNNIKTNEKSYKNILIFYIVYVAIKDSKYIKMNSVNPLYLYPIYL